MPKQQNVKTIIWASFVSWFVTRRSKKCILCICKNSNCKLFFFPIFSHSLQLSMRFTYSLARQSWHYQDHFSLDAKIVPFSSLSYHEENPFQNFLPMWSERHKSVMASSSLIKEQPNILKGSKNQGHHHSKQYMEH